jgi:RHS repeat-associated protein
LDAETALYDYRTRFYHALLGQFLSRDQIIYDGKLQTLYEYSESNPITQVDPLGEKPCPAGIFTAGQTACRAKFPKINRTWLIYGCKASQNPFTRAIGYHYCCFGSCQFYEGWCIWGANLPANDGGKWAWTLTIAECRDCADKCMLAGGVWPCKKGGGTRGPRWPSSRNPFVPAWDDVTKPKVADCQLASTPGPALGASDVHRCQDVVTQPQTYTEAFV